ncbi:uncharacterized protein [Amphiura filiformis]|uniref:uncharacterized protein n=1 Tax=Amphiura filiformis TaxID=82378 RepID=UPI003B22282E
MATTDDNDNQGSSTGGAEEISVDDIANENSPCNDENRADNTVDMTTKDQNSSIPLNLTSSRLDSNLVPFPDDNVENDAINSSQSSPTCENTNGVNNEEDGDEDASVCEQDRLTPGHDQSLPLESNKSPECEGNKLEKNDEKVEGKGEDSDSAMSAEISHQNENIVVSGDGQRSECNKNDRNTDSSENGGAFEEERGKDGNLEDLSPVVSNCEESMDTLTTEQNVGDGEDEASKPDKELVDVSRSATSTPQFTSILNSEESDRQDTPVQSNTSFVCGEEQAPGSIISDQNSQSSLADEPPILISSEAECFIHLDEETFNEWSEKRRKMGFDSDAAMAKFMLRRLAVDGCSEGPSDSQDTERSKVQIMESQSKQKKSITFGGIESIVRRLHQVRSDTPETSQPGSDNEDIVKIKTEPVDMCNSDDVESAAIPKKATTAIYSSGRNGRKRVYVKREPGTDEWMQNHDSPQTSGYDDQQVSDYADHYPPIRIKQEKIDPSDTDMVASKQSKGIDENPTTIGQFVRSAASWVSNLVASELEKPQETAGADAPDTAETLFSDSRLHKIIEEQLSKPSEPSVSEIRLQSVIEEQLNKPTPKIGCALIESVDSAQSKAAKKEMKKARREARQAKKLKKAQKA